LNYVRMCVFDSETERDRETERVLNRETWKKTKYANKKMK